MSHIGREGYNKLWDWFGLSYASWLTLPRVLRHEMPDEWQSKMSDLLREYDEHWDFSGIESGTRVQLTEGGNLIKTPDWLKNYRHPELRMIRSLKAGGVLV